MSHLDSITRRHEARMDNINRRALNSMKDLAIKRYAMFKQITNPKVKRLAGLGYLRLMGEIRDLEARIKS